MFGRLRGDEDGMLLHKILSIFSLEVYFRLGKGIIGGYDEERGELVKK